MASLETSKPRRPGRKLTKRQREPGRIPMDLPERFKYDDDDDDQVHEEVAPKMESAPFMHQSVFGMIAAAQSKNDFRSAAQESDSESEEDCSRGAMGRDPPEELLLDTQRPVVLPDRSRHSKRLSDTSTSHTLSGLRPAPSRSMPKSAATRKTPLVQLSPLSSPAPASTPTATADATSRDVPVMSQMLEARAKADMDSSRATLIAPKSGEHSLSASTSSSHRASLQLPDALKDIFQFDEPEDVIAEYPCWYLQSVLLQGYMYITQRHICFYAYLQQKANVTIKSGHMSKRGKRNPQYHRYWFVLKGTVLSYFVDAATLYFPSGIIDLRYGISAELVKEKDKSKDATHFSVTTDKRIYFFKADSTTSAKEWVKQLQKVIFRSHNDGDSVKISLPIDNILDVEDSPVIDFAETIKVRVIDNDDTYAVDEYFFSFFTIGSDALQVLKIMTQDTSASKALRDRPSAAVSGTPGRSRAARQRSPPSLSVEAAAIRENVRATLSPKSARSSGSPSPRTSGEMTRPSLETSRRSLDRGRTSFDRPQRSTSSASRVRFSHSRPRDRSTSAQNEESSFNPSADPSRPISRQEDLDSRMSADPSASQILSGSHVFRGPSMKRPPSQRTAYGSTTDPNPGDSEDPILQIEDRLRIHPPSQTATEQSLVPHPESDVVSPTAHGTAVGDHQRPGMSRATSTMGGLIRAGAYPIKGASNIAGLIKDHGKRVGNILGTSPMEYYEKVSGMWVGGKKHYSDADGLQSDDHVYDPDEESDTLQAEMRFREHFALPDSERLVASYFGHLLRVLPLYGKVYIGSTKLCFRSMLPGTRTKLVIPFTDILNVDKEKGFRFGYSGMVVVIRGHEEIFVEFASAGLRDDCTVTVLRALDSIRRSQDMLVTGVDEQLDAELAAQENTLLREARQDDKAERDLRVPRSIDKTDPGVPSILFDDPAASLLDFKPQKPLNITCLTIGSRGDVQPYIALCKGFLREGHRAKIATHGEFEPWVRKYGIDFAPVDGDPAELMRICVDNGMFTPSFLYEANSKFRGFLETLLQTAWTACQGSDLLIESPSAMAGIHIAEALEIPYFRAFTMPWTRTRAYPHAFAVPNHKMGGAYNYMTYVFFDNIFWQSTAGQVNRWRRKSLGLRPTTLDKLQPNKVPFLYNFSPSVVVPPLDFSDWIRVTGYWFLDEAKDFVPPRPLVDFIQKARDDNIPLVYIGFGSVVVPDSKAMTQNIIDAVLKADVRCILSKGWSDRLDKKDATIPEVPLPSCMFQISSAPHDWLFKQIDAAVHHGGAGTTGASLRAGVPTVIKPFFGDQFFFGNRVQDLGVGLHIKRVTENTLGKALWIASHDQRMKDRARRLGEQIRKENGVENAIKAVYRDMEYAKTLIKKRDPITAASVVGEGAVSGAAAMDDLGEEHPEEAWTFVENDSDPEFLSPTTMHGTSAWEASSAPVGPRRSSTLTLRGLAGKGRS